MNTIVVLGTGSIGTRHLDVLHGMEGITPIAVSKRPLRGNELAAAGYNVATDLTAAVEQGATHCIVASDTGNHLADCESAMELGLEVLVEKPAAIDSTTARKLQEMSLKHNRRLYVGCVMRFSESLSMFKKMLSKAGRLHAVRVECQSYMPDWRPNRLYLESYAARPLEGGVLLDLIHEIDYSGWIFGWPKTVAARVRNLGILGIAADEAAALSWDIEPSLRVSIYLDYLTKPPRRIMRAFGDQGTLEWNGIAGTVTFSSDDTPTETFTSNQERNDTFSAQSNAFLQASQGTDAHDPRLASIEEGGMALSVCDAARNASTNLRDEPIKYF